MNRILTIAILLFSIALPICAQVQTGSILIKITDAQGAIMPGVSVSLSSPVLSGTTIATTDERGVHRFPSLLPGTYAVKLALPGFQTLVRENVIVMVGQTTPLDLQLRVATLAETITVTEASPMVD